MTRFFTSTPAALSATALFCVLALGSTSQTGAKETTAVKTLEIIVPWGTGGGADHLARQTATLLNRTNHAPTKVTNIAGRTGNAGMENFLASPNDGDLLLVLTAETYCLVSMANPGWNPSDVVPIAIMMRQP